MRKKVIVVIPNWNGGRDLPTSIDSVLAQTYQDLAVIVVDNGSDDDSRQVIEAYQQKDARVSSILRNKNYGYTGGVNPGIEAALREDAEYVAPFNNDAVADKDWLKHLVAFLDDNPSYGIAACAMLHADGRTIDSTADQYTTWGLAFPRGRGEPADRRFGFSRDIFGASGGASLYRCAMLRQVGLFDQDFFAYYEDIDLSFRAQLAGWKVGFVPEAVVYHEQGKTSARLGKPGKDDSVSPFITTQFMKNVPFIVIKDVPAQLLWRLLPRFVLAYNLLFFRAVADGRGVAAVKGAAIFWLKLPGKLAQRRRIQKTRKVSIAYLWGIFVHDLPPNAHRLRKLRASWWRLTGRAKRASGP